MISKRSKQILLLFLRDKHKKNWFQIIKEFATLYYFEKKIPVNYITSFLYRKSASNYKDYLTIKESEKLLEWSYSYGKEQIVLAENKLLFEELLTKNNIPTPQIFFHNSKNKFTYKNTVFEIENKKDFFSFLETVFNDLSVQRFFCKPIDGSMGRNIFVLDKNTFRDSTDTLINSIFSQAFIFQEVILQHESLNKINSFSANTLRIVTYKPKDNKVEILSGLIRFGRTGAIVDNSHTGGLFVSFNKETGKIRDEGVQLLDNGGGVFYKHPDTGIVFDDFQIPYFNEVRDIVIKASNLFKIPLLGWDIAITPNGPVIIEANHDFYLLSADRMENGLKKNPVFNKLLQQIKQ